MKSLIKNKADPNILNALEELNRLIKELKKLYDSFSQRGEPGSVDLAAALHRAQLLRQLLVSKTDLEVDWFNLVQTVVWITELVYKLWHY